MLRRAAEHPAGCSELTIRHQLGLSPTVYCQLLLTLIDRVEAHDHDPELVGRLRDQLDIPRLQGVKRRR